MGKLVSAADSKPGFKLLGVKYPTLKAGERPKFGHRDIAYSYSTSAAISAGSDKKNLRHVFWITDTAARGICCTISASKAKAIR